MFIEIKGNLSGKISEYYIQTFSMLFFEDTDFSKSNDTNKITVTANQEDNNIHIDVTIKYKTTDSEESSVSRISCVYTDIPLLLAAGQCFYELAVKMTGITPPWGIHTGIRPQNTAEKYIKLYGDKAVEKLCKEYKMKREKAELSVRVSKNAADILSRAKMNSHICPDTLISGSTGTASACNSDCSLYVSIPFCPTRCNYCSFTSQTTPKLLALIPEYIDKITAELIRTAEYIKENGLILKTVYIGGGTPTILNERQLSDLLTHVPYAPEYTVEAGRADTVTEKKLRIMKDSGVNRICINPQTLNDDVLHVIGRRHTAAEFYSTYETAKKIGFDCINTDIIIGLPTENEDSMYETADKLIDLAPDNISVHTLCLKKSAALTTKKENKIYTDSFIKNEYIENILQNIYKTLENNNYMPYYMYKQKYSIGNNENTGFSKTGKECLYNIYMMDEIHTVIGIGAGATTKTVTLTGNEKIIERDVNYKYPYEMINGRTENNQKNQNIF